MAQAANDALLEAAERGDLAAVTAALDAGANKDIQDEARALTLSPVAHSQAARAAPLRG